MSVGTSWCRSDPYAFEIWGFVCSHRTNSNLHDSGMNPGKFGYDGISDEDKKALVMKLRGKFVSETLPQVRADLNDYSHFPTPHFPTIPTPLTSQLF